MGQIITTRIIQYSGQLLNGETFRAWFEKFTLSLSKSTIQKFVNILGPVLILHSFCVLWLASLWV